ncbi:MAG: apolipoprotein N-acyltransferase [Frankiales bacterium]|nr:apolipoprotein N-acyltransferase [Frankiales bacterium]
MTARPSVTASALVPVLLALASGTALALSFPPYDLWWLAPVGVALLSAAVRGRRARTGAVLGLLCGLVCFVVLISWLRVVGVDGWLVVAVLEAVFFLPLGALLGLAQRAATWPVLTALLWTGQEALRVRVPFGGFPWGRLAFSQPDTPFTPLAAIGGAPLVTFAVALTGAALLALADAAARRSMAELVTWSGSLAAVAAVGLLVPVPVGGDAQGGPPSATVALVQGNVPRLGLDFLGQKRAVLTNHVAATAQLAAQVSAGTTPRPDAVLWPENASDLDPFDDAQAAALVEAAVKGVGVPVLVGAVLDDDRDPEHYVQNAGVVWDPVSGPGERYVKRHPVPFGEYLPFRSVVTKLVGRFALVPRDFRHGNRVGVLDVGPVRIGDVICFEIAYDGIVRDAVKAGGRAIVVQTNNATYGRTGETEQQLAMSRLRAVEHGREVLVVATSGVSAVISPDGRVVERSAEFTRDLLVARVPLRGSRTVADHLGAWPELAATLAGLLWSFTLLRRRPSAVVAPRDPEGGGHERP